MKDEGQTDAAPAASLRLAAPDPVELVEDSPLLFLGDPDALVRHHEGHAAVGPRGLDAERLALGRVLDRVVDEVGERLADGIGVERRLGQIRRHVHLDLEAVLGERIGERLHHVAHERLDRRRHALVPPAPALDAREVEHVVDEAGQPLALARDDPVILASGRLVAHAVHLERLPEHADHRQRGLQIVRDVGHEIRLQARHLRLAPHEPVRHDEAGPDDDDEHPERRREQHDLPPHRLAR